MKIINPATQEVLSTVDMDTLETVTKKYAELKVGQKGWHQLGLDKRIEILTAFKDLLIQNRDQLALELTKEVGKPLQESLNEINGAAHKMKFFLEQSVATLATKKINHDGNTEEFLGYDPLGVITNISAWNYPYLVGINIFLPALVCGNAVLYKPSEYATLVGKSIERLLHAAGVPKNVFSCVVGDGSIGKILCNLPLDGYFFTGSFKTGKAIAQSVAHKLVPVGLELGGKDPLYVTEDVADIKSAAVNALEGAFYNNGQSCCGVERVYVHEKIYNEFISHFIAEAKNIKAGDPLNKDHQQGAITRHEHLPFLKNQVDDAVSKGAKLECGGHIIEGKGNFFAPTVLTAVTHEMLVMKQESFGPIIGVMKVSGDEEAIKLMNDTDYGLTSAIFTSDRKRGEKILSEINSGTGYLNCCDRVSGYLPWSGRGHSGLGSTLSIHGLYAFCHPKAMHIRG